MGCKKDMPHRMWKQKEKLMIVKLYLDEGIKPAKLNRKYGVNPCLIHTWSKLYLQYGEERLRSQNGIKRENSSYSHIN